MAAEQGDLVTVSKLLKKGVDPNFRNAASGVTPLGVASERGHLDVMRSLIDAGASVNNPTNEGVTPIHIACQFGPAAGVELLCRRGANVNTPCPLFANAGPLLFATQLNKPRAIEVLIAAGADVNGADKKGWTAMHAAASFGHEHVVKALLAGGADPSCRTNKGESPLDVALEKVNIECINALRAAINNGGSPRELLAPADGQVSLGLQSDGDGSASGGSQDCSSSTAGSSSPTAAVAAASASLAASLGTTLAFSASPTSARSPPVEKGDVSVAAGLAELPEMPPDILEEDAPSVARAKKIFHGH